MDDSDLMFSFQEDEEDQEPETQAAEGGNRAFLFGVLALVGIFAIGILAVAYLVFFRPSGNGQQVAEIELTNQANMTAAAATEMAAIETQSAPTEVPEVEPTTEPTAIPPSPTPTSLVTVTVIGEEETAEVEETPEEGEETPEVTEEATEEGTEEATEEGTEEATEEATEDPGGEEGGPTPLVPADTLAPTSQIIEVTPLGGGEEEEASPTPVEVGEVPGEPTGVGGPVSPTALPETGLLDRGPGLAGLGLLAVALVAVVVIARRIRLG